MLKIVVEHITISVRPALVHIAMWMALNYLVIHHKTSVLLVGRSRTAISLKDRTIISLMMLTRGTMLM